MDVSTWTVMAAIGAGASRKLATDPLHGTGLVPMAAVAVRMDRLALVPESGEHQGCSNLSHGELQGCGCCWNADCRCMMLVKTLERARSWTGLSCCSMPLQPRLQFSVWISV